MSMQGSERGEAEDARSGVGGFGGPAGGYEGPRVLPAWWRSVAAVACAGVMGAGTLIGFGSAAMADPVPRPGRRPGHYVVHQPSRPRVVARCQNDETNQVYEITGNEDDGNEESADPLLPSVSSRCPRTGRVLSRLGPGPRQAAGRGAVARR
jgi:hypothetical protein